MNATNSDSGSGSDIVALKSAVGSSASGRFGRFLAFFLGKGLTYASALSIASLFTYVSSAQTDITSTLATLSTYWVAALAIGVPVLLWVVGRMLVHKGTRG